MTAYLLVLGIIGFGALIANQIKSPSTKNEQVHDVRGPMTDKTIQWLQDSYQHKVIEARKALADRMRMADGWARYV